MSIRTNSVAIVGAGIAGLAAARTLTSVGIEAIVFEKSRGLGGRMATRRTGSHEFDHGAQYFTAKGEAFRAAVAEWGRTGVIAAWGDDRFVGTPGMTTPARALADGIEVVHGAQVSQLVRDEDGGWTLRSADGLAGSPANRSFDAVILAVPAPQALPLATTAGIALEQLREVRMAPCWALLIGAAQRISIPGGAMRPDDPVIAWIADNTSKPGRTASGSSVVVHATPEWSRNNLQLEPEAAAAALLEQARRLVPIDPNPTYLAAHRWRFALVEKAVGEPCLWNATARLGACGDWCMGPRVEAAFDSGEAMARVVLESMGGG
jgi:predicted NAD/FAD-dependent oxidoreductase